MTGLETLTLPQGTIEYTLTRKRVKNLNLRVKPGGEVVVSAPLRMPKRDIDAFMRSKADWLFKTRAHMQELLPSTPCRYSKEQCLALFEGVSERIFPVFAEVLKGQRPALRVREMKSRWGVCYPARRCITLNQRLAEKPLAAIEYVVLHEYVHFLHPNHQKGFHDEMARLMPDYKERRKLLK